MRALDKHLRSLSDRAVSGRLVARVALGATATMLAVGGAATTMPVSPAALEAKPAELQGPAVLEAVPSADQADQRAASDEEASRSARRASKLKATRGTTGRALGNEVNRKKPAAQTAPKPAVTGGTPASNRALGMQMCADAGFSASQCADLGRLWERESGWSHKLANSSSGAFGIPQSLPGSKMASAGSDWRTNPATQIKWGLGYIKARYANPSNAWAHSQSHGWY